MTAWARCPRDCRTRATLTRLANEFFRELPGQPAPAVLPVEPPPAVLPLEPQPAVRAAPQPATAGFSPPSPFAPPGLLTTAPELPTTAPEWAGPAFALPGGTPAAVPSFYFVDERPAAAAPAAVYPASPAACSTSRRCAASSRSSASGSTDGSWSGWTTRPRRRSRRW